MVDNLKSNKTLILWALPLTSILFFGLSKWYYAIPIDGPHANLFWGYPLPYCGFGYHTSMGLQFFILEFIINFIFNFSLAGCLIFLFEPIFSKLTLNKLLFKTLYFLNISIILIYIIYLNQSNTIFNLYRSFDWNIINDGINIFGIKFF